MVKNINSQQWLDEKYPVNGTYQGYSDKENKGKKREEITTLDISKGQIEKNIFVKEY